jgi:hypothetical protein
MQRQAGIYSWHSYRPDSQEEKPANLPVLQSTKVDDNQPRIARALGLTVPLPRSAALDQRKDRVAQERSSRRVRNSV